MLTISKVRKLLTAYENQLGIIEWLVGVVLGEPAVIKELRFYLPDTRSQDREVSDTELFAFYSLVDDKKNKSVSRLLAVLNTLLKTHNEFCNDTFDTLMALKRLNELTRDNFILIYSGKFAEIKKFNDFLLTRSISQHSDVVIDIDTTISTAIKLYKISNNSLIEIQLNIAFLDELFDVLHTQTHFNHAVLIAKHFKNLPESLQAEKNLKKLKKLFCQNKENISIANSSIDGNDAYVAVRVLQHLNLSDRTQEYFDITCEYASIFRQIMLHNKVIALNAGNFTAVIYDNILSVCSQVPKISLEDAQNRVNDYISRISKFKIETPNVAAPLDNKGLEKSMRVQKTLLLFATQKVDQNSDETTAFIHSAKPPKKRSDAANTNTLNTSEAKIVSPSIRCQ